jgi:hypothetical protein
MNAKIFFNQKGQSCALPSGERGTCKYIIHCPEASLQMRRQMKSCGNPFMNVYCCPIAQKVIAATRDLRISQKSKTKKNCSSLFSLINFSQNVKIM